MNVQADITWIYYPSIQNSLYLRLQLLQAGSTPCWFHVLVRAFLLRLSVLENGYRRIHHERDDLEGLTNLGLMDRICIMVPRGTLEGWLPLAAPSYGGWNCEISRF